MGKTLFALVLVLGFTFGMAAMAVERPNFSGEWMLNLEKSKLDPRFGVERGTITIVHAEPNFRFSRVFVLKGQESASSYELTTDGKESVTEENGQTVHSRLYWDGDILVFDVRIVRKDGRETTNVVRYSLADQGRTFISEEKFCGPVLKYDNLWVSDKKL